MTQQHIVAATTLEKVPNYIVDPNVVLVGDGPHEYAAAVSAVWDAIIATGGQPDSVMLFVAADLQSHQVEGLAAELSHLPGGRKAIERVIVYGAPDEITDDTTQRLPRLLADWVPVDFHEVGPEGYEAPERAGQRRYYEWVTAAPVFVEIPNGMRSIWMRHGENAHGDYTEVVLCELGKRPNEAADQDVVIAGVGADALLAGHLGVEEVMDVARSAAIALFGPSGG